MLTTILIAAFIGLVAGWIAGEIYKGSGFGILGNIVVGLIGSLVGSFIANALGFDAGDSIIWNIVIATFGAIVLLAFVNLIRKPMAQ